MRISKPEDLHKSLDTAAEQAGSQTPAPAPHLPEHVLETIFSRLDARSLGACASVSKDWKIGAAPHQLWQRLADTMSLQTWAPPRAPRQAVAWHCAVDTNILKNRPTTHRTIPNENNENTGQTDKVEQLCLNSDGRKVATRQESGRIRVASTESNADVVTIQQKIFSGTGKIVISPDGKTLLTMQEPKRVGDVNLRAYDTQTGHERPAMRMQGYTHDARFNADGSKLVLTSYYDPSVLIDVSTWKVQGTFGNSAPEGVDFSSDGRWLLAWGGEDDQGQAWLQVCDGSSCEQTASYTAAAWVGEPILTLDAKNVIVACQQASSHSVHALDIATGVWQKRFDINATYVGHIWFSPDGHSLVAEAVGDMLVMDAKSGARIMALTGSVWSSQDARFSDNGKRALLKWAGGLSFEASSRELAYLVDLPERRAVAMPLNSDGPAQERLHIELSGYSPDGSKLAARGHQEACILDIATGEVLSKIGVHAPLQRCYWSQDGSTLAVATSSGVQTFDFAPRAPSSGLHAP